MSLIIKAAQFAADKHRGQFRKYTNTPFITHPIRVAGRVATHLRATEALVAAAYLHDVVENTDTSFFVIHDLFGPMVTAYVSELTDKKHENVNREERNRLDRERIRGISDECKVVKLIDRIDNLREMDINDPFLRIYLLESAELAIVLDGVDSDLSLELCSLIADLVLKTTELKGK